MVSIQVKNRVTLSDIKPTAPKVMAKIGGQAITMIRRRTEKGRDFKGRKFRPYSKKPGYYKSPLHRKSVFYRGGYAQFKSQYYGRGTVDLLVTGQMLGNLQLKRSGKDYVLIGFTRPAEQAKAAYHNLTGAGKKRVKRTFMKIKNKHEIKYLANILRFFIRKEIAKSARRK